MTIPRYEVNYWTKSANFLKKEFSDHSKAYKFAMDLVDDGFCLYVDIIDRGLKKSTFVWELND